MKNKIGWSNVRKGYHSVEQKLDNPHSVSILKISKSALCADRI